METTQILAGSGETNSTPTVNGFQSGDSLVLVTWKKAVRLEELAFGTKMNINEMNMKLSSLLPQMACALLLMASCSQEDSMTPGENPSSVGGIHITTQVSGIVTRGITETATLQNFGICIQGSGEHASSLQYNNVEMTKNGEEWTSATPMLWKSEIPSADIIAYAPYQADISEALATQKQFPVSVKAVQTKEDLSSDLLVFKAKDYAPAIVGENKDKIVEVKFDHAFSQLMVTFNFDSAFPMMR